MATEAKASHQVVARFSMVLEGEVGVAAAKEATRAVMGMQNFILTVLVIRMDCSRSTMIKGETGVRWETEKARQTTIYR